MSYINSALKKVQEERESRYQPYSDLISLRKKKPGNNKKRWTVVVSAMGGISFLILAFIVLNRFGPTMGLPKGSGAVIPSKAIITSPMRGTVVVQEGDQARRSKAAQCYESALTAQRGKRWEEAEKFYQQALALNPQHIHSLNNLGVIYMSQNRYADATELFIKAIAAQDDYVEPYYNLACLYAQMNNITSSLSYLRRAMKIDSNVKEWAMHDTEFTTLRLLPEFKKLMEELVK